MPKKKGFTQDKYEQEILNALKLEPFMSTNEISEALSMGDVTSLKYLEGLHKGGKINLKKVGNRRFWYV